MKTVFIDGSAGTTGLRIYERLAARRDLKLLVLPEQLRKDPAARKEKLNEADLVFLCLPDDAAREAAGWVQNPKTVILDTSTAHRTAPGWCYGFPELIGKETVRAARRIAVPGCHASGFVALVTPLIRAGLLPKDARLCCHSITGYSGGGKKMIADYEGAGTQSPWLSAPRQYGLTQNHKHLKEMTAVSGLDTPPLFCPIVASFYSGMEVTVPLFYSQLATSVTPEQLQALYQKTYPGPVVRFAALPQAEGGFCSAAGLSGSDRMELYLAGNEERLLLIARYDNLGKGASGAAIQCMNLVMDASEEEGLE